MFLERLDRGGRMDGIMITLLTSGESWTGKKKYKTGRCFTKVSARFVTHFSDSKIVGWDNPVAWFVAWRATCHMENG